MKTRVFQLVSFLGFDQNLPQYFNGWRFLVFLFAISSWTDSASAQSFISSVELFAGPSILSIRDNGPYDRFGEPKIGYSFGLALVHKVGSHWAVNTQIEFERKGYKLAFTSLIPPDLYNIPPTNTLPPVPMDIKINFNNEYITISLLPRYSIGDKSKVLLGAGPYYGRLIRSQVIRTVTQNDIVKEKIATNQKESFESHDLGISYYVGVVLKEFEKTKVFLRVNYKYGLRNVIKLQPGIDPIKNNSLVVAIGIEI